MLKDGVDLLCSPSYGLQKRTLIVDELAARPPDGDGPTRQQLAQIEAVLRTADGLRLQERWQEAIGAYQQAQHLIIRLTTVVPRLPYIPHDLVWSRAPELFEPLLSAGLALVDRLAPEPVVAPPIGPPSPEVLGQGPDVLRDLGVKPVTKIDPRLTQILLAAERNAAEGRHALAADQWRQGLALLGDAATADARRTRAETALNLGTTLAVLGQDADAADAFERAGAEFSRAKDTLGAGQARHNLGVIHARQGKAEEAKASFAAAAKLLNTAHGSLHVAEETVGRTIAARTVAVPAAARPAAVRPVMVRPAMVDVLRRAGEVRGVELAEERARIADAPLAAAWSTTAVEEVRETGKDLNLYYRDVLVDGAFSSAELQSDIRAAFEPRRKQLSSLVGGEAIRVEWEAAAGPPARTVIERYYEVRVAADTLERLRWTLLTPADTSVYLAHLHLFVIPMGLGDCYYGLGSFARARATYLSAAEYPYLNTAIELPTVWRKVAQAVLAEGDQLYKGDDPNAALEIYGLVIGPGDAVPAAQPLYGHPKLKLVGDQVQALLGAPAGPLPDGLGAGIAAVVLDIRTRVTQIVAGLDWFGLPATFVPPFTFDYLQNAARYMAQQAIQNEREFVGFRDKYDTASLTRLQLVQAAELAKAEQEMYRLQKIAAQEEVDAASAAVQTAQVRRNNAIDARNAYAGMSAERNRLETEIAWYSAQNEWELNNPVPGTGKDIHEIVAENRQRIGDVTREYELARMQDQIDELGAAVAQAQAQRDLSRARLDAAEQAENVAGLRATQAAAVRDAFDDQFFTPEVWFEMAQFMRQQANRYLHWATRIARLMQAAYRFEHDSSINKIRTDYAAGVVKGLLGGDQLMADIDYFTFHHLTTTKARDIRAKSIVSLADRFPFELQAGLRATGTVSFETLLSDIERQHPGTYNHRLQDVEVQVIGMTPPGGFRGLLTNAGISQYRRINGDVKWRVQPRETLALTAYTVNDLARYRHHDELLGTFEGAGLASSWTLSFPPDVNDVDFRFIVDVQVIFYYTCRYSPQLAAQLAAQPVPPEALRASRVFSARWDFPDRFFLLAGSGVLELQVEPADVPFTQVAPTIRSVAVQLLPNEGSSVDGVAFELRSPAGTAAALVADATGLVPSSTAALAPLAGGSMLGAWRLEVADEASRAAIRDVLLFVEYDFTRRVLP